jgi:hypothetical protein
MTTWFARKGGDGTLGPWDPGTLGTLTGPRGTEGGLKSPEQRDPCDLLRVCEWGRVGRGRKRGPPAPPCRRSSRIGPCSFFTDLILV